MNQVRILVQIVLNTLEAQFHKCQPTPHLLSPVTIRSRDLSTASVDLLIEQRDEESETKWRAEASEPSIESEPEEDQLSSICEEPRKGSNEKGSKSSFSRISEEDKISSDEPSSRNREKTEKSTSSDAEALTSTEEKSIESEPHNETMVASNGADKCHSPLHRVCRSPSPSTARPSLQRMSAVEVIRKESVDIAVELPDPVSTTAVTVKNLDHERTKQGIQVVLRTHSLDHPRPCGDKLGATHTWSIDPMPSKTLLPLKPKPERLLPIGPSPNVTKGPIPFKSLQEQMQQIRDQTLSPVPRTGELHLPSRERLLPIGPFRDRSRSRSPTQQRITRLISSPTIHEQIPMGDLTGSFAAPRPQKVVSPTGAPPLLLSSPQIDSVVISIDPEVTKPKKERESFQKRALETITSKVQSESTKKETVQAQGTSTNTTVLMEPKMEEATDINASSSPLKKGKKSAKGKKKKKGRPSLETAETLIKDSSQDKKPKESAGTNHPFEHSISLDSVGTKTVTSDQSIANSKQTRYKQRRQRKPASGSLETQRSFEGKGQSFTVGGAAAGVQRRARKTESGSMVGDKKSPSFATPSTPLDPEKVFERCPNCSNVMQAFSEEELGMSIVILGTFIHREPALAAPILPDVLKLIARFAFYHPYSWQSER